MPMTSFHNGVVSPPLVVAYLSSSGAGTEGICFCGGGFLCREAEAKGGSRDEAEVGGRAAAVHGEEDDGKVSTDDGEADNGLFSNTLLPLASLADGRALNRLSDQLPKSEVSACNDNRGGRAVNLFSFKLDCGDDSSC